MGVRFECPAGHKLHVKAHLAGQRGICPECGARFIVPTFSGGRVPEATGSGSFDAEADGSASSGYVSVGLESSASYNAGIKQAAVGGAPAVGANGAGAGDAIEWYVRPATGGQFGPVDTTAFQQWVGEGRVAADAWVWRTGWADWKPGGEALKTLGGSGVERSRRVSAPSRAPIVAAPSRRVAATESTRVMTPAPAGLDLPAFDLDDDDVAFDLPALPTLSTAPPSGKVQPEPVAALTPAAALRLKRRKTNQRLTLILALLAGVLLIVLIVVMTRPKGEEATPAGSPPPAPSAAASAPAVESQK